MVRGTHADAIATFLGNPDFNDGAFALESKYDTSEQTGIPITAENAWFVVDDGLKQNVPAGYEFIGEVGTSIWLAPEVRSGESLWPGFSTESVPNNAIDGNTTKLTLVDVDGPEGANFELWASSSNLGAPIDRLWSASDEDFKSWTLGRVHKHASWAFTKAGRYDLTVEAEVAIDGQKVTDTAVYTFFVGDDSLPAAQETQTSTARSDTTAAVLGEPVQFSASVLPRTAQGWVEFVDTTGGEETVLGHAEIDNGDASMTVSSLELGTRDVIARFVPEVVNYFTPSTASAPLRVTVTAEAGGDELGIYPNKQVYEPGDEIVLEVRGMPLQGRETIWWRMWTGNQPDGSYILICGYNNPCRGTTVSLGPASATLDGARVQVLAMAGFSFLDARVRTDIVLQVSDGTWTGEQITFDGLEDEYYSGDPANVTVDHRDLEDGESARWVRRAVRATDWSPVEVVQNDGVYSIPTTSGGFLDREYAYQILGADQNVIGQSAAIQPRVLARDVTIVDLAGVYRDGQPINARANVYPALEGVTYQWGVNTNPNPNNFGAIAGATDVTFGLDARLSWNRGTLKVRAFDPLNGAQIAQGQQELLVVEDNPANPLVVIGTLNTHGDHLHSTDPLRFRASAVPEPASNDRFQWYWKLPGEDEFAEMPRGNQANVDGYYGEQGLSNTQVYVVHRKENGEEIARSTTTSFIVYDHGSPPPQRVSVKGAAPAVSVGDEVTLTAEVTLDAAPQGYQGPATHFEGRQWFVKLPGQATAEPIEGATDGTYTFVASQDWDGAQITAAVVRGDGRVLYGPSQPVTVHVDDEAVPGDGGAAQTITAELDARDGALVISVDPDDRVLNLPTLELSADGKSWGTTGELRPVTVTDTRPGTPGWSASGQVGDFTSANASFDGAYLGWGPKVLNQAAGQGVNVGDVVAPGFPDGDGLSAARTLASADTGKGKGTARLGADLELRVPTDTPPGLYQAILTFTAI
ncbi:choice-of-anchor M domain-containing protein [Micromonospora craniellae]|uniref:choice-of-anchor M domain-containing protein n=1 Tax=Micromonospora craniellae TaxID=2294034 RepID=UPI001F2DCA78|nr:choice-of-anchor M domain-containing protein [Micromonospora craniellae]